MHYSVQPRDQIFVTSYGFLSFVKNMGKNVGKNTTKNFSGKYSHRFLNHAKQSAIYSVTLFQKEQFQKSSEATDDLIGNKIPDKFTQVSQTSPESSLGQLEMRMINKYFKKDIYLQKKGRNLFII